MLSKGEAQLRVGLPPVVPGLIKLTSCKLGYTKMTDFGLSSLIKACPNLNHLELNRCDLTDVGLRSLSKELPQLKFLDLSSIPSVNAAILEEIKVKKPELLVRSFRNDKFDPKDNGLRVPRRVIEKAKKKGKKGKKSK